MVSENDILYLFVSLKETEGDEGAAKKLQEGTSSYNEFPPPLPQPLRKILGTRQTTVVDRIQRKKLKTNGNY